MIGLRATVGKIRRAVKAFFVIILKNIQSMWMLLLFQQPGHVRRRKILLGILIRYTCNSENVKLSRNFLEYSFKESKIEYEYRKKHTQASVLMIATPKV
jgi:hypothetical protein